jgi:predicted 3-demethylubiquinone-9 3-methyltransferase (glyoxalase superfamily)
MISVRPHLWFGNDQAAEAARFYAEHIPNSAVTKIVPAPGDVGGRPKGADFIVEFTVAGVPVIGLNAGPDFHLNEAFSFYLRVETQEEVDHYWDVLTADGGEPGPCGWCKDKFGLSWQIAPENQYGDDPDKAERALGAIMKMKKFDIAALEQAVNGDRR